MQDKWQKTSLLLISLILFSYGNSSGQLSLTNSPQEGAFLAQDARYKRAITTLEGAVTNDSFQTLYIKVYQSGNLIFKQKRTLSFVGGIAPFSQKIQLPGGRYIYKIQFELHGSTTYVQNIDNLMVGDVYLVQGQSNAVAGDYSGTARTRFDTSYYDPFIRSFGTSSPSASVAGADLNWYQASAAHYSKGCIGQWAAVMAKCLLDSFDTPVCLLNGAVGGTRISLHTPDANNEENLNTIYGRLLYRVRRAGLKNNIKGILYFQGESDGSNAALHDTLFKQIYLHWNKHFPNFEKLYVIQVRSGCGGPSIQLRDVQRRFEFSLDKCQTVSANGLNGHDGCHYDFVNGYELLGQQMGNILGSDLYGSTLKNIGPPNIKSCFYSNASQTEITLNMRHPDDSIFVDTLFQMLFRVEGDNSVSIINGFIRNNQIVLQLNKSSCNITGLTYDGLAYKQPWVKSASQMGLLSFYNVAIVNHQIKTLYEGCRNEILAIGEDSIAGCSYLWRRKATGGTYTTSKVNMKVQSEELFSLILSYSNSCRPPDTLWVTARSDSALFPNLGKDKTICQGDTILFSPSTNGYSSFTWSANDSLSYDWNYETSTAETVSISALSDMGCMYRDTAVVAVSIPQVQLPADITICPENDTLLSVQNTFKGYVWNGVSGSNTYLAKAGRVILEIHDSFNCVDSDTTFVKAFESPERLNIVKGICSTTYTYLHKPNRIIEWSTSGRILPDTLLMIPGLTLPIVIRDSNFCTSADTIKSYILPLPEFSLGVDTGFCAGESLKIRLPDGDYIYYLDNVIQDDPLLSFNKVGRYTAKVVDSNACFNEDVIEIVEYPFASLSILHDTILCIDSKWKVDLLPEVDYTFNDQPVFDSFTFTTKGEYRIKARNHFGCENEKSIEITFIDCSVSNGNKKEAIKIRAFPNPFVSQFHIVSNAKEPIIGEIADASGRRVLEVTIVNGENIFDLSLLPNGLYFLHWQYTTLPIVKVGQ